MKFKIFNTLSVFLRGLVFAGFTTQIILGMVWAIYNINICNLLDETTFSIYLSEQFGRSKTIGILYPACLLLIRAFAKNTGINWYIYVYVLQLFLAGFSGFFMLKEIGFGNKKWYWCLWGSFVIMSFPLINHIHLSVIPNSFTLSFLLLQIAMVARAIRHSNIENYELSDCIYDLSGVLLFWLLEALTENIYLYIGLVPVCVILISLIVKVKKVYKKTGNRVRGVVFYPVLLVFLFAGFVVGIGSLAKNVTDDTNNLYSKEAVIFNRIAWKSSFYRQASWRTELTDIVGRNVMVETSLYQGNISKKFLPAMVDELGEEEANATLNHIINSLWVNDKKEILHDLAIDTMAYAMPPVIVQKLLEKSTYVSYTIRNYDLFTNATPKMSKLYMDFSLIWFEIVFVIGIIHLILGFIIGDKFDKKLMKIFFIAVVMNIGIVIKNVMLGNSMFDYKQAGFSIVILLMLQLILLDEKSNSASDKSLV